MNIWIITTGSSDVQLKTDKNWNHTHRKIRNKRYNNHNFIPERPKNADNNEPFQVPARVMGIVYGENLIDEHYDDICFPIFNALSDKLEKKKIFPDKIIIIFTDQSKIFDNPDKKYLQCPFWQDTCTLKPIIYKYFKARFPNSELEYKYLIPTSKKAGLDNWDSTLNLVEDSLSDIKVEEDSTIYVSHQAGTPAISSAIQFMTLAKFGNQVQFLVSNEYQKDIAYLIPSPKYLWAMKLQEATALLQRHDYDGVKDILEPYLRKSKEPVAKKINQLLEIAIQWNYANFQAFVDGFLEVMGDVEKERFDWWWTGYEAAYLAVVRLEQGNTVEALFHSFRAVEGTILEWAKNNYPNHTYENKHGWKLRYSILQELPKYRDTLSQTQQKNFEKYQKIGLFGNALFKLLQTARPEYKTHPYINIVWDDARKDRNNQFHRLLGLTKAEVFDCWNTNNQNDWEKILLGCLEFISKERFTTLKDASLISQVHKELENALQSYQP